MAPAEVLALRAASGLPTGVWEHSFGGVRYALQTLSNCAGVSDHICPRSVWFALRGRISHGLCRVSYEFLGL